MSQLSEVSVMYQVSVDQLHVSIATAITGAGAAVLLFGFVLAGSDLAVAEQSIVVATEDAYATLRPQLQPDDLIPEIKARLLPGDEIAALEAVDIALTQASDGATYVWSHGNGRLNGTVRMTGTFRDADSRICRSLQMRLVSGTTTRQHDGVACRQADGAWLLGG